MTRAEAIALLRLRVPVDNEPALSAAELSAILDECERYSTYTAATAYVVGDVIVPAVWNGRQYRAIAAGTSHATTAPTWPASYYRFHGGYSLSDGSALIWEDAGPAHPQAWDITAAVRKAWELKAAKDSELIDASVAGGDSVRLTQRRDFALRMANRSVSVVIA